MSKLGDYLKKRKEIKAAKKLYQEESSQFVTSFKEWAPLVLKQPDKERKAAQGRLTELNERLTTLKMTDDPLVKAPAMTKLLQDLKTWKDDMTKGSAPTTPTTPVDVDKALEALEQTLKDANLDTPPLLTAARDPKATAKDKQAVLDAKGELIAFAEQWKGGQKVEDDAVQQTAKLVPVTKAFDAVHTAWEKERTAALDAWKQLKDAKDAAKPGALLYGAALKARSARDELLRLHAQCKEKSDQTDQRVLALSRSQLLVSQLSGPSKLLTSAQLAFANAGDKSSLESALQQLKNAADALETAVGGKVVKSKTDALVAYDKLRLKLEEVIAKCGKLRGAGVPNSPVEVEIEKLRKVLDKAGQDLAKATIEDDVAKAGEPVKTALDGKPYDRIAKLAKTEKEKSESDLKALPDYQKQWDALQHARARVAQIPGAHVQLQQLDALIAANRVEGNGRPKDGYAEALKAIKSDVISKIEKDADKVGKEYTTKTLPQDAQTNLGNARKSLDEFAKVHTVFELEQQKVALALAAGGNDPKTALETFDTNLKKATQERTEALKKIEEEVGTLEGDIKKLPGKGMLDADPALAGLKTSCASIRTAHKELRLADARRELDAGREIVTGLIDALDKAATTWKDNVDKLGKFHKKSEDVQDIPAFAKRAGDHISSIDRLLNDRKTGQIDLHEANRRAVMVLSHEKELDKQIADSGLVGAKTDVLKTLAEESKRLQAAWKLEVDKLRTRINELDAPMKSAGVKNGVASTPWPAELKKLEADYAKALGTFKVETGKDIKTELQQLHDGFIKNQLKSLSDKLPDPKKTTDKAFIGATGAAKGQEDQETRRNDYNGASQLLAEARLLSGQPLTELGDQLGAYKSPASEQDGKLWASLKVSFAKKLIDLRREANVKKAPMRQEAHRLKNEVGKKLLDRQSVTFRGLFDDLGKRLDDALAMLDTDDATLIEAATRQIAEIKLTITESKGKGDKAAVTLEQVQKRWADLSHVLGDGAVVQDRLPATYTRLKGQLDKAIEMAKRLPPDQGMAELEKLQRPILEARKGAKAMQQRYEGYKLRRDALDKQLDQVKSHTGTTLGNRMTAYNERFASRIGEANLLAKQQGQMDAAYKAIADLEKELADLLALPPDEARVDLQKKNAEAETEQRELRDLARTWSETQAYWEDTLLPAVDKAVDGRDEDDTAAESLRASVTNIAKTLEPYLEVISLLPHKRNRANGAPEMKAVRAAFSRAYSRLAQLEKVAIRLRDGGGSTNVDLEKDLKSLEAEWASRVQGAQAALSQLAGSMKQLPSRFPSDDKDPNYIDDNGKKALEKAANDLNALLSRISNRFRPTEFSDAFKTLANGTTMPEKKKAREAAIRTVHQLAADIAGNRLFNELYEGAAKGLIDIDVRPQISLLRAGLKKIELAVLVGI